MTITKKFKTLMNLSAVLSFGLIANIGFTQSSYDEKYIKWKAEQQQQDKKLKTKIGSKSDHYFAKPCLSKSGMSGGTAKVHLNSASLEQLMQLSGVGKKKAEAIIEYRNKNGKFNSVEDFMKIKGVGPALFNKNKDKLAL